jgi:hypothetical protein
MQPTIITLAIRVFNPVLYYQSIIKNIYTKNIIIVFWLENTEKENKLNKYILPGFFREKSCIGFVMP